MLTQSNEMPTQAFKIEKLSDQTCDILFYKDIKEIEKEEQVNYEYQLYRLPGVYRDNLSESIEENYEDWLEAAIKYEDEYKTPLTTEDRLIEMEKSQLAQDEEIITTQDAVNFLLFDSMGTMKVSLNNEDKNVDKVVVYIANQISRGKVTYEKAISKYQEYKEDIDSILIAEGREELIIK